jgi:hypothetical protein
MKCDLHQGLENKIDLLHKDMTDQNDKLFGLLESQLKQKDNLNTKIILGCITVLGTVTLGYFGIRAIIPFLGG